MCCSKTQRMASLGLLFGVSHSTLANIISSRKSRTPDYDGRKKRAKGANVGSSETTMRFKSFKASLSRSPTSTLIGSLSSFNLAAAAVANHVLARATQAAIAALLTGQIDDHGSCTHLLYHRFRDQDGKHVVKGDLLLGCRSQHPSVYHGF